MMSNESYIKVSDASIGVIGGSGLYEMAELSDVEERALDTPYGAPSAPYVLGTLSGKRIAFLPRHGRGHVYLPHEIPFRANIHGFKQLGVEWLISVSAVGSLKEDIHPGHIVIPDQFIDLTKTRVSTFFGDGVVAHVSMADPVCGVLSEHSDGRGPPGGRDGARGRDVRVHGGSPVQQPGGEFPLPRLGRIDHRDDEHARGQARARGGDELRHHRACDRL